MTFRFIAIMLVATFINGCAPSAAKFCLANPQATICQSEADTDVDTDTDTDTGLPFTDEDDDGYSPADGDCDDSDPDVHPGATEIPNDGVDNDCAGGDADAGDFTDNDGDGYTEEQGDCNDANPGINPDAQEICDGIDQDCDDVADNGVLMTFYQDLDGDGYGAKASTPACTPPDGTYIERDGDCDDGNDLRHPGAVEACTDTEDMNCDGSVPGADADHDSYASCEECDDSDPAIHPGATEICNTKDDDCDGTADEGLAITYYRDADGDTFGDAAKGICASLTGYVNNKSDCDDTKSAIYPKAPEYCDDSVDSNCDGDDNDDAVDTVLVCKDKDCDLYAGSSDAKSCPSVIAAWKAAGQCFVDAEDDWLEDPEDPEATPSCGANPNRDCDDTDATINWDAVEISGDGIDQDCDGED
jgi:hypothetical protein